MGVCNAACKEENEGIYAAGDVIYTQLARVNHAHLFQPNRAASSSVANLSTNNTFASGAASSSLALASGSDSLNSSQPVVQAGFTTSNSSTSAFGEKTSWPDEDSRQAPRNSVNPSTSLAGSSGPANTNEPSSTQGPVQLMCILRDANGKQQVVTIDQPSPALLQAIQQNRSTNR